MKTTKLIFSITLVALAAISFGQLLDQDDEVIFYTSNYNEDMGRMDHWIHNIPGRAYLLASSDEFDSPVVSRAYFVRDVEVSYNEEYFIEDWMTTPFETALYEQDLWIESWMVEPFDVPGDEVIQIESWMTTRWI